MTQELLEKLNVIRIVLPTPFPVGPVNVYLLPGDPLTLIDTGLKSDETYRTLSAALNEHGYAITDLEAILATHGHRDHIGLLGRLQQETGAKVYAHPLVEDLGSEKPGDSDARRQFYLDIMEEFGVPERIREEANSLYDRFRSYSDPFTVDHDFLDSGYATEFRTYFVPGHSPSDTLLVHESRHFTITGDHILTNTTPNPLLRRPEGNRPRPKSLLEFLTSLRRSRSMSLGLCLPGHGDPISDHVAVIDRILEKLEKRSVQVLRLVRDGLKTPFEVSQALFPQLPHQNLHLGLSIAVGHMEVLEEDGLVRSTHERGVLRYSAKRGS